MANTTEKVWYWSELADLTHATQVENFGFCTCEEQESFPYEDCPRFFHVLVSWHDDPSDKTLTNVAIAPSLSDYPDDPLLNDDRIFFYFANQEEYDQAKQPKPNGFEFRIEETNG
jgi:hypothetical protein